MNKLSAFAALATAALIGIAAEAAGPDEATPTGSAAPAVQTPVPVTGPAPGWFPPPPNGGGYAQSWQQPPQWPVPGATYGQWSPYYPRHGQYWAVPATPVVNPLSAELKQTQEQLTAKNTELDMAHAMLEQLQGALQRSLEAEQALREKVADITGKQQALQAHAAELTTKLNTATDSLNQNRQQITNDQQQNRMLTAARDRLRDDLASRDRQLATVQAELQAAMQAIQQAQSENALSSQQLGTAMAQTETLTNVLTQLNARLESQKTTLHNVPQALQQAQSDTRTAGQQPSTARAQE